MFDKSEKHFTIKKYFLKKSNILNKFRRFLNLNSILKKKKNKLTMILLDKRRLHDNHGGRGIFLLLSISNSNTQRKQ